MSIFTMEQAFVIAAKFYNNHKCLSFIPMQRLVLTFPHSKSELRISQLDSSYFTALIFFFPKCSRLRCGFRQLDILNCIFAKNCGRV